MEARQASVLVKRADERLRASVLEVEDDPAFAAVGRVAEAIKPYSRSWSGSNLGHQSGIYYKDLAPVPPGAVFSQDWGLLGQFQGTTGQWSHFDRQEIIEAIKSEADFGPTDHLVDLSRRVSSAVTDARDDIMSIVATVDASGGDFLTDLTQKVSRIQCPTYLERASSYKASESSGGWVATHDRSAAEGGILLAPHEEVALEADTLYSPIAMAHELESLASRLATHLERMDGRTMVSKGTQRGTRVFIGHGRSSQWRELKDFVHERLELPYDEFNREPVAGTTNIDRLSTMLDDAAIAFLVLTAEDEDADGELVARQNVVHEAGLFQGRLGFARAIILVESGCKLFSNIDGLGQIRFPANDIASKFEEVRRLLEREGLIKSAV